MSFKQLSFLTGFSSAAVQPTPSSATVRGTRYVTLVRFCAILLALWGGSALAQTPPQLSTVSPSTLAAGVTVTVTLTGSNFTSGATVTVGSPYGDVIYNSACSPPNCPITLLSSGQMTVVIPGAAIPSPGTVPIKVTTSGGSSNSLNLTVVAGLPNPVPITKSISPNTATAGGAAFTLSVTGANFVNGVYASVVQWNGAGRTTTFINNGQLTAPISAADIASAGTAQVTVLNPAPGGGTSTALPFTISPGSSANPNASPLVLSPASAPAGGGPFTLIVTSSGFTASSIVRWNGSNRQTTFVSSTELQIPISDSDIANPGTALVTVAPAPSGAARSAVFSITGTGVLIPAIVWTSPQSVTAGGQKFNLTIYGSNFVSGSPGSVVQWNGAALPTTFVNSNQLTALVPAANIAQPGMASIVVVNPASSQWSGISSEAWLYALTTTGVTTFPAGPQPPGSAPVAIGVDEVLGYIYVVHRELYRDVGVNPGLPASLVTVLNQQTGAVITTIGVGAGINGSGQGIAVDSTRHLVYVTNAGEGTVTVIDGRTNTTAATIAVDSEPEGIAVDPDTGIVYVAAAQVTLLDGTAAGAVLASVPVGGEGALAVAVDRTTHLAYVLVKGAPASIAAISGATPAVQSQVSLPALVYTYTSIAVDPGARVYASDYNTGTITPVNISGATPAVLAGFNAPHGFVNAIAVDPVSHLLYVSNGGVTDQLNVLTATGAVQNTFTVLRMPTAIAIAVDSASGRGRAYVADTYSGSITALDTTQQPITVLGSYPLATLSFGLAFDSSTNHLYAPNFAGDAVSIVDAAAPHSVLGSVGSGAGPWAVAVDTALRQMYTLNATDGTLAVLSTVDGSTESKLTLGRIGSGTVAVNSTTHKVYVSDGINGQVFVVNPQANPPQLLTTLVVGGVPVGIAIDESAGKVYVASKGSGNITVIDAITNGIVGTPWQTGKNVWKLAVDPGLHQLYASLPPATFAAFSGLLVLDSNTGAYVTQIAGGLPAAVPSGVDPSAEGVAVNPSTQHVFLTDAGNGTVTVVDGSTNTVIKTFVTGTGADGVAVDASRGLVYTGNTFDGTISVFADPAGTPPVAALSISKSHTSNFTQGQANAVYTVIVSNSPSAGPTSGTVTVTEAVPAGMTLASMAGTGWTCAGSTCMRGDALAGGASYPAITVTVNVAANAASPQVNQVSVSGGGSPTATATDSTSILSSPSAPIIDSLSANFLSDGTFNLNVAGRDSAGNVKTLTETRLDSNGQQLGGGTFDITALVGALTSFSFTLNITSGNLLSNTRQVQVKLTDVNGIDSNTMTANLSGVKVTQTIPAGGVGVNSTSGTSGTLQVGYGTVILNSGSAPYGTAVFSFKQNGVTVGEAGVPASPPTTEARIFVDYRSSVAAIPGRSSAGTVNIDTGIAVVNYGSATANLTYALRNVAGATLASGHGTLAAGAHFATFIDQLNVVAPDFVLPLNFQTATQFASLEISSDQLISVLALRMTTNQRNEALFTTTPTADLTKPTTNAVIFFPQFADGGGYTTSLVLLNTSNGIETGTIQLLDDNGIPFVVSQVGGTAGSVFRYSIPSGGAGRFQTDGSPATINAGWAQLTPDAGTSTPIGAGLFSYNPGAFLVTESGIPATVSTKHARIYVDMSGGHDTGLAIANPTNTNASITITAFQSDGVTGIGTSQGTLQLPANGHSAGFADQFIAGLPAGFTGVLDITSSAPFAALTMRSLTNERGDFLLATFPVADMTLGAPSPIVFPQIADGGGYVTQFILIGAGGASSVTLNYYGEDGKPLAVGK